MSVVIEGEHGTITVPPATLTSLVTRAAERVEGVRLRHGRRHHEVKVSDNHARVTLELVARYGAVLPDVARGVQEQVTEALSTMCGLQVDGVDVVVEEVE